MTRPVDDVLVAAARAALDELERLHGLHAPKYEGKLGEPDLDVIRPLRAALRPYRRRKVAVACRPLIVEKLKES